MMLCSIGTRRMKAEEWLTGKLLLLGDWRGIPYLPTG